MSRFFPHPPYAEDQPLHHTILATHVLHRGFQSGSVIGLLYGTSRVLVKDFHRGIKTALVTGWPAIQRSVGFGSVVGTSILAVALPLRMAGLEEIEWKDRSWRLLENKGQLAVDDWSVAGILVGLGSSALLRNKQLSVPLGWKTVLGRAGLGSTIGVVGYLTWTYITRGSSKSSSENSRVPATVAA
ncbi:hypothetical protein VTN77DRAFT_4704 [Rasamsonia byssochlamydoides]|uniref:uncharacterized protein n=1 Tax=Rasamsonia byssochlamydoides TaxID=89139 RepID=UPI003743FDA6